MCKAGLSIKSGACPLSEAVIEHPEICRLAEALVAELVERPVETCCQVGERPRCCFAIAAQPGS
jgi:hypothetical protein